MSTIANLFSPPLLAAFCGVTLGAGAVLFVLVRRDAGGPIELRAPLSWSEPVEVRMVLYLILGATCGTLALIARLLFASLPVGSVSAWLVLALVVIGFLCNLAFFYAAGGSMLQAAMGTPGRPSFWFSGLLSPLDAAIMDVGDVLARFIFHPSPSRPRRRSRARYAADDNFDDEYERPSRRRAPRADKFDDEYDRPPPRRAPRAEEFDDEYDRPPRARSPRVDDTPAYRPNRTIVPEGDEMEQELPYPIGEEVAPRRSGRGRNAQARDVLRERLDLAIQEWESSLTPAQREKLREMRVLVEAIGH